MELTNTILLLLLAHLTRQDIAEAVERVVQSLVVNGLIKVFDKEVSYTALAMSGISMTPHNANGLAIDLSVVQSLQSSISCCMRPKPHQ